jgi:hypothetical protein
MNIRELSGTSNNFPRHLLNTLAELEGTPLIPIEDLVETCVIRKGIRGEEGKSSDVYLRSQMELL